MKPCYITKRKGIYNIFTHDRIHIGQTTRYANIRHIIDNHRAFVIKRKQEEINEYWMNKFDCLNLRTI